jgi:hypothetical protein
LAVKLSQVADWRDEYSIVGRHLSYYGRAASFHGLSPGCLQCSLSTGHADAIGEHSNTDK